MTPKAPRRGCPLFGANKAPVAVVQNGVEHRERFAPYMEEERLLPVVIDCPVERGGQSPTAQFAGARRHACSRWKIHRSAASSRKLFFCNDGEDRNRG